MPTKNISAEIKIQAAPAQVWNTFTDFARYPDWNPFITHATGTLAVNERLIMQLQIPDGRKMSIKPIILAIEPEKELRWVGRLLIPGLFTGEHRFVIRSINASSVLFVQEEQFRGILVPFFGNSISAGALRGFEAMNAAMKELIETG